MTFIWVVLRLLRPYRAIPAMANCGTGQKLGQNYGNFGLQKQTVKIIQMGLELAGTSPVASLWDVPRPLRPFRAILSVAN